MRPMRQLLRQPMKTLSGVILVALAVAVLAVCLGQGLAAGQTARNLEYDFTTIAMPTDQYNFKMRNDMPFMLNHMNEEVAAWIDQVIAENPGLAVGYTQTGLASAYIPELEADHYSTYASKVEGAGTYGLNDLWYNSVQDCAMFVVTLEEIGEPKEIAYPSALILTDPVTGEKTRLESMKPDKVTVTLQARIDQVLCLAEELDDPTGWPIELTLDVGTLEELEELDLQVGGQYIINGMSYFDNSQLIGYWVNEQAEARNLSIGQYDNSKLYFLTEEDAETWLTHNSVVPIAIYGDKNVITDGIPRIVSKVTGYTVVDNNKVFLFDEGDNKPYYEALQKYHTAKMILVDKASLPQYGWEDTELVEQLTREITVDGETVTISWEEYKERYSVPTIAKLSGSVEDFLAENQFWSDWLGYQQINTHAFPIYGVDKLDYIADFNRGLARITQGRDFTQEELASGAKVCVISETLAQLNGLSVGDTISPQFYDMDYNTPYQYFLSDGGEVVRTQVMSNPVYFHSGTEFVGEAEPYTVVGIYREDAIWEDYTDNHYGFTPNAIFVPKEAVAAPMDYGEVGLFKVLVLQNGKYEEFDKLVMSKEFETITIPAYVEDPAVFVYSDQGYMAMSENVMDFAELARQVLIVGIVVYGIVLILFLLLYPGRQGKALRTMALYGTPRKNKITHVLLSALGILLPGTVLGAGLGIVLWGVVVGRLLTVSGAMFSLTLDLGTLALIAIAQLLLALALTLLLAIPMTTHKNIMKRK